MAKPKSLFLLLLRLAALGGTTSAAVVMATAHQTATVFTVSFEAKYTNTPAFKYFVIVNAVASVYGLLVLFLPSQSLLWRFVVFLDELVTLFVTSAISAALAIAYVGKEGNNAAGWLPICGQVPRYCNQVGGALIASVVGGIAYKILLIYSIHSNIDYN